MGREGFSMLPEWFKIELREKWDRLSERLRLPSIRGWFTEHPTVIVWVAGVLGLLLLVIVIPKLIPDKPPPKPVRVDKEWYYDLNTGKLFVAPPGQPPIEAPSGPLPDGRPAGVRAYVLSYKADPNESERFIAYLETTGSLNIQSKPPSGSDGGSAAPKSGKGRLIRRVDAKFWVPADSPLGLWILREAYAPNKNGQQPNYCWPR
jgi:hypothetical protein